MNRAISLLLLLVSALACADLSGKYEATAEGRKYTLTIKQAGKDLSGDINDGEQSLALTGTVEGDALTGTLKVPSVNVDLFFKGSKTAKGIKLKIAPPNEAGKADWNEAKSSVATLPMSTPRR